MTDITDQEKEVRRIMDQMQGYLDNESFYTGNPREWLRDLREVFPEPPAPTLAEELRSWAEEASYDEDRDNLLHAATRAKQIEQESAYWKDYALDRQREVERLTAERLDRNPATKARVEAALNNIDNAETVAVQTAPNPADVPMGEAWQVEVHGENHTALRVGSDWWISADRGGYTSTRSDQVRLIARLVPAPRIVTDADELDALPEGAIV